MSAASVPDFLDALRDSQLLPPALLEEVLHNLPPHDNDPQALARELANRGTLTLYQAEQLLQGQGKELVVGPYTVLEPVGEGGMGQVFKALQSRLNRFVALKVIRQDRLAGDTEAIRRFHREALAAAQLSHPNVVIIYDADQAGDRHYIAMEYVEGTDLARLVAEHGPLPVALACDFIRQAALGLQHAFECGMVHRDIKPQNLLVTAPKQRSLSGIRRVSDLSAIQESTPPGPTPIPQGAVVKILDMGLARLIPPDNALTSQSLTQEGTVMGTPDYIAPEQARDARSADIRADLYSLGCTFYFILTGQPPFPEGTVIEKLLMHQLDEPQPVEELRPDIPAAVAAVVRKLIAKRPEDRYQTPAELAAVLAALPPSSLPLPSAGERSRDEGAAGPDRPPSTAVVNVKPNPRPLTPPEVTPDGSTPLTAASYYKWTGDKAVPLPSDVNEAKRIARFEGHRGWVTALAFSPDRNMLVSGGVDGAVRGWTFSKSKPRDIVFPHAHRGEVNSLAFSPDCRRLASGSGSLDGLVWLWELNDGAPLKKIGLAGHTAAVEAMTFSPDGRLLATVGCDRSVRIWDLSGQRPREWAVLKGHTDFIKAVAFAPDSKTVATGSQDGTVRLWSIGKLWSAEQAVIRARAGHVRSLAFSPDGQGLALGCMDQSVRLWDISGPTPKESAALRGHLGVVRLVLSPPDGSGLLSVGDRGTVILWDVAAAAKRRVWGLPSSMICSVAATFDGRYLATGGSDGVVTVYRLYPKKEADSESK